MTFYDPEAGRHANILPEEESIHCVRVLRQKAGDQIEVFNGQGSVYQAVIETAHPKRCSYRIIARDDAPSDPYCLHLAIAPTKNMDRIEWMLEKCVEIGVHEISFISCDHSERNRIRLERLQKKAVSAMKQSRRAFATQINPLLPFADFLDQCPTDTLRHIAYVPTAGTSPHLKETKTNRNYIVLVGPEGDFSTDEIQLAMEAEFTPTSLGNSRLRTETAGLVACTTLAIIHA